MTTRMEIVAEARTWVGTPFHHQARLKGVGVDCIGVPVCAARACGVEIEAGPVDYPRQPTPERTLALLEQFMDRIEVAEARIGDLLFVWFAKFANGRGTVVTEPSHFLLISTDGRVIHAYNTIARESTGRSKRHAVKAGRVVEAGIPSAWLDQIHSAWRFRGLED